MLQILPALLCAPIIAGLVLGGDQRVGAAAPFRREVKVARRASDRLLDMGPPILNRLEAPLPLIRRRQERAESTAIATCAFERVSPGPVPWRVQRQRDAPAQMVERRADSGFVSALPQKSTLPTSSNGLLHFWAVLRKASPNSTPYSFRKKEVRTNLRGPAIPHSAPIGAIHVSRSHSSGASENRDRPQCDIAHQSDLSHIPTVGERFRNERELTPAQVGLRRRLVHP